MTRPNQDARPAPTHMPTQWWIGVVFPNGSYICKPTSTPGATA